MNYKVKCSKCNHEFSLHNLFAVCPKCQNKFLTTKNVSFTTKFGSCYKWRKNKGIGVIDKEEAKSKGLYTTGCVGEI